MGLNPIDLDKQIKQITTELDEHLKWHQEFEKKHFPERSKRDRKAMKEAIKAWELYDR